MNSTVLNKLDNYPRVRRFGFDLGITAIIVLVIAIVITYVFRVGSSFLGNLIISTCIGTLCAIFIDGTRLMIWGLERPPRLFFFLLVCISMPLAQYFGNQIAAPILGVPLEALGGRVAKDRIGYFVITFLCGATATWFFWNRGRVEHLKAEAEAEKARAAAIEKQALQAQLQMLQAQIEPHMLFNTLANLQGMIAMDSKRAQHMLDQLIQYLRATLSSSRAEHTTLAQEFALMEAYLGLMSVRMGARLSYTLDLPAELAGTSVPPMLLQPLVENAIKHGLEPKMDGGHVAVRAQRRDGVLQLTVTDTGLGLAATPSANGTHLGVANVRERLRALYGERASFSLTGHTSGGVLAQLEIPT
jgi:signal transduction histidine kinase